MAAFNNVKFRTVTVTVGECFKEAMERELQKWEGCASP